MSHQSDSNLSQQIEIWKEKYGAIFKIHVGGSDFIYRSLTISEYRYLLTQQESEAAQDWILNQVILHPHDMLQELEDPQILQLYNTIFQSSYFGDEEQIDANVIVLREEYSTNLWKAVCIFILTAMPTYKIDELESLTVDKLLDLYMIAELLRGEQLLAPVDPRQGPKKQQPQQQPLPQHLGESEDMEPLSQMSASKSHQELGRLMAEHQEQAKQGVQPKATNPFKDNKDMDSYTAGLNRK